MVELKSEQLIFRDRQDPLDPLFTFRKGKLLSVDPFCTNIPSLLLAQLILYYEFKRFAIEGTSCNTVWAANRKLQNFQRRQNPVIKRPPIFIPASVFVLD